MATTNLGLAELTVGQASPEVTINDALGDLDAILTGQNAIALADSNATLTVAQVQSFLSLDFTGAMTAVRSLQLPVTNLPHFWLIRNSTTGGFRLELKYSTGTTCHIPPSTGGYWLIYADGTNVYNCGGYKHFTRDGAWATSDIDFSADEFLAKAVTGNVTLTASNFILGRTVWAEITVTSGSPTFTEPAEAVIIDGAWVATSAAVNHIEMICVDDTEGAEKVLMRISQE